MGHTCDSIEIQAAEIKMFLGDIKKSIEKKNASFDKLRACFSMIDFISSVWKDPKDLDANNATPKKSVEFIREVMGEVNPLYKELAAFLYVLFRHPLAHSVNPKAGLILEGDEIIILYTSSKKGKHLKFERVDKDSNIWKFYFNADQFQKDIICVIDNWIETITEVNNLLKNYDKVNNVILKPEKECDLIKRNGYNFKRDFDYIRKTLCI